MPRARIYKTNAERQQAYRDRKKKAERAQPASSEAVVKRVMAADRRAT